MNEKWNPNLAVAKMDPENDHFSSFWQCAWREKCGITVLGRSEKALLGVAGLVGLLF